MTQLVLTLRDELDRKVLDSLQNEILRLKQRQITPEAFIETTRVMWEVISGLASQQVCDTVSEVHEYMRAGISKCRK